MSKLRPAGPFSFFNAPHGAPLIPLYLISFDKEGRCLSPKTLEHMRNEVLSGAYTDVHIYSHGWNNIFKEAVAHYTEFFTGYFKLREDAEPEVDKYKPLVVGIIWPSTALVSERDEAPKFAADIPADIRANATDNEAFSVSELAAELPDGVIDRFLELVGSDSALGHDEALELAGILLPIFQQKASDTETIPEAVTPEKLVRSWEQITQQPQDDLTGKPGTLPIDDAPAPAGPEVRPAGLLNRLNPKEIVRVATVYLMKDRAGTVGARGVAPVLNTLLEDSRCRIHLTGHSYGAKVILSALCLREHPRKVHSVLLLQPAVNAFCFAYSIQENGGRPGAYRVAFDRTVQPVFSTFSARDSPLTTFFHVALRRDGDLGEMRLAAGPPSKFAALGGFGPGGMQEGESRTIKILDPPARYDLSDTKVRVYALDGSGGEISSHGDVRTGFTQWALLTLVSREPACGEAAP